MKTIPAQHLVAAVAFGALAVVALIFVPDERLAKLVTLVGRVIEDPAGALAALSLLAGAITTLRAAWLRQPPPPSDPSNPFERPRPWRVPPAPPRPPGSDATSAEDDDDDTQPPASSDGPPTRPQRRPTIPPGATMVLALSLVLVVQGCGASALRMHSTAASIASATIGDLDVRVAGACGVALSSCRGEAACREETAERCRVAAHAAEGLVASVRAYHDGITAATYADEGEVLPALMAAWRGIRDAWPAIRAALTAIGLDVSWTPEAL